MKGAWKLVKWVRVVVSLLLLFGATVAITAVGSRLALALGWIEKLQIFPAAMAGAIAVLALWAAVTVLFGRVYCSTVCPLGALQDGFARMARLTSRMRWKNRYCYSKPQNMLRYGFLALGVLGAVLSISVIVEMLDPYSLYERLDNTLLRPLCQLVDDEESQTTWSASSLAAWWTSLLAAWWAFVLAVIILAIVAFASWRKGRLICNTVCPVGSALSVMSRVSLLHFDIDTDVCTHCRKCEHVCKAQCINLDDHVVDGSRCVMCFNCIAACDDHALRYTLNHKKLSLPMLQPIKNSPVATMSDSAVADQLVGGQHDSQFVDGQHDSQLVGGKYDSQLVGGQYDSQLAGGQHDER